MSSPPNPSHLAPPGAPPPPASPPRSGAEASPPPPADTGHLGYLLRGLSGTPYPASLTLLHKGGQPRDIIPVVGLKWQGERAYRGQEEAGGVPTWPCSWWVAYPLSPPTSCSLASDMSPRWGGVLEGINVIARETFGDIFSNGHAQEWRDEGLNTGGCIHLSVCLPGHPSIHLGMGVDAHCPASAPERCWACRGQKHCSCFSCWEAEASLRQGVQT